MKKRVKALVLTGFGLNCDMETAHAFELAGASAERVHINDLIRGDKKLEDFHILAFGGGFSWGDDHGAGVLQALKLKNHMGERLLSFIDRGNLIIGICNGFQTLVNLGLLPGLNRRYQDRTVALTWNDCGNFRDHWVHLKTDQQSPCVFTRGLDRLDLPVRHGEGKFVAGPDIMEQLALNRQIVLRYADETGRPASGRFPLNPNGSLDDIAGICDPGGRIFGLMPHPEAFTDVTNHPDWIRQKDSLKQQGIPLKSCVTSGRQIFKNGVDYMESRL
ncbi:MAG: phosphoribosylformylglycinamidine synthase subunit PurQ [Thermodesulfobacteriota bacterium]|nr:phosphoribosylformylglycinamidine synthase subunit PurQ [Thermodesulfobacteriota bacterium]